jgi:uncharacterized membrane protein YvlD (DUF360 family)
MNREWLKNFRPAIVIFIILTAFFISGKTFLEKKGFNQDVLLIGNLFLFVITGLSFWMMANGMKTKNTSAFLRGVYGGIMLKLFGSLIVAFIYIMTVKKDVNKPGLFLCMGLYIVYTFIEVKALMKLSSAKKDA